MQQQSQLDEMELHTEAVVIGGGLSGLAAAIHLARGGMRVLCLEPLTKMPPIVGESLDWSAPGLLGELGLPMEELIAAGAATWKRHVVLHEPDGSRHEYEPGAWLQKHPWNVEVRTLHLDRPEIQSAMERAAAELGVQVLREKALTFDRDDDRLTVVTTSRGRRIHASWFVDASGSASSILARQFKLRSVTYGPRKVALWAHLPTTNQPDGTNLHMLSSDNDYMEWVWEIPIRAGVSSVGYVAPGSVLKAKRANGLKNTEIFQTALQAFPRLGSFASAQCGDTPCATSFRCRSFRDTCGPNWVIVGEAASQSDPITGNGVTAALRHSSEASSLLLRYRRRPRIPLSARRAYSVRVLQLARFFNSLIENVLYQPDFRKRLGLYKVGRMYTIPAWLGNLAYSRLRPTTFSGSVAFCSAFASLRTLANAMQRANRSISSISVP